MPNAYDVRIGNFNFLFESAAAMDDFLTRFKEHHVPDGNGEQVKIKISPHEVPFPKEDWSDTYQYRRILEVLDDYWLTEPTEAEVRVSFEFFKANGEHQTKHVLWRNPKYHTEGNR